MRVNFTVILCLMSKFPSFPVESRHTWDYFYTGLFLLSLSYVASHMAVKRAPPPHRHVRDRRQWLEGHFLPLQHGRAGRKRAASNYSAASLNQLLCAALLPGPQGAARLLPANAAAGTNPIPGDNSSQTSSQPDGAAPRDPIHAVPLLHPRAVGSQEGNRALEQAEGCARSGNPATAISGARTGVLHGPFGTGSPLPASAFKQSLAGRQLESRMTRSCFSQGCKRLWPG